MSTPRQFRRTWPALLIGVATLAGACGPEKSPDLPPDQLNNLRGGTKSSAMQSAIDRSKQAGNGTPAPGGVPR